VALGASGTRCSFAEFMGGVRRGGRRPGPVVMPGIAARLR